MIDKATYHTTLKKMQDSGVSANYWHGWASGALGNPPLEEQRVTEAYTAGFDDGANAVLDGYGKWTEALT